LAVVHGPGYRPSGINASKTGGIDATKRNTRPCEDPALPVEGGTRGRTVGEGYWLESQTDKSLLTERRGMAEKITLIEIHAHTDDSSLDLEPSLGSGVGSLVSSALGGEEDEDEEDSVVESLASSDEDEGEEGGEDEESEVLDLSDEDEDEDEDDEDEEGTGAGTGLAGLLALVAFVFLARNFLGEDEEEDPFEEEFGQ
jgi:hypothetical protein